VSTSPDLWVAIKFVVAADGSTPADVATKYGGKVFLIDPATMGEIGSGPSNPGYLLGVRGYMQAGTDTAQQWVMQGLITAAMIAQFNAIPGTHSWTSPSASQTFVSYGRALLNPPYNAPAPDVMALLQALYTAAVLNYTTAPPGG
jgi:hypothetical protein